MSQTDYTPQQLAWAAELHRCRADFAYAANHYLSIKTKQTIGLSPLRFNRVQARLWAAMADQLRRTGQIRQIWGKSRQVGSSTLSRAFSFWNCAFRPNRNAILIAHDEPSSYELFTIDKLMYEQLPKALKPKTSFDSKFKLEFPALNSKIVVGHARNMNVGASQMSHIAHLTEVARYPNPDEVQASLFPAFSDARGQQDYSAIILESTSHFNGAWFKEFAEQAQRGENGFEFHFVPWFEHEDYTLPVPDTFAHTLTMDERDLMRRYKLTLGQIAWRRQKRATYVNPVLFEQEYPLDWESSWRLPMGTHRVFGDLELAWIEDTIAPGVRYMPTARGLEETFGGMLEVWQPPREGVCYHLGVNGTQGRDTQAD